MVSQFGFTSSPPKEIIASALEKVGRLKRNGQLRGYSPLSRVLELEALSVGIAGKLVLWQSLQGLPLTERLRRIDLEDLIERARRQREEVEEHRQQAASQAFVGGAGPPPAP